jgi:hypothetical protein
MEIDEIEIEELNPKFIDPCGFKGIFHPVAGRR